MHKNIWMNRFALKCFLLLVIFISLFSAGCRQNKLSKNQFSEETLCRLFLEHLMIREGGLYTLLGSKPMTHFDIAQGFSEDLENQKAQYHLFIKLLDQDKVRDKRPTFEEYVAQQKAKVHLDFRKLWEIWKTHYQRKLGEKYIIISSPDFAENWEKGLFINIPHTIYVLKKYQDIFEKEVGITYSPDVILKEINDKKSAFWTKVFSNSYLFGLLMGYGEMNSLIWTWCNQNDKIATIRLGFHGHPQIKDITKVYFKNHLKVSDLLLPTYVSFSIYDETLETYQKEREAIIRYFHKKDFVNTVLGLLKTQTSKEDQNPIIIY